MSESRATLYCCAVCSLAATFDVPGMARARGWVQVNGRWLCKTCARTVRRGRRARKAVARRG